MASHGATAGVFGFNYNRGNFKFDQGLRWKRYTTGRGFTMQQFGMFREDVKDLTDVAITKTKVYAPMMTVGCAYCMTMLVESRTGMKFPGPPVWMNGIYFQCLAISFCFNVLGIWFAFHTAMKSSVAAVSLRTRHVRVPVPTQKQLDSARKLLSTFEEQGVYDMLRLPYVMPNAGSSQVEVQEDAHGKSKKGYQTGGLPGVAAKLKSDINESFKSAKGPLRMPGFTKGNPGWLDAEVEAGADFPKASPSGYGLEGPTEPFEHFELIRKLQREWWSMEAYMRICFLFSFMHLIQSFCYWMVLHTIAELLMVWHASICAAALSAVVWLLFRLDVLPEAGGCYPVEAGGPFFAAIAMSLAYTMDPRQPCLDVARGVAVFIVCLQILWTFRLYTVAKPGGGRGDVEALEDGAHLFNQSAACDKPTWLPNAFQHIGYMIAPPKTKVQLDKDRKNRANGIYDDEPVDMTAWYFVRAALFTVVVGWGVLLGGQIVEITMGERALTSIPGHPPWSRTGQWFGWEHGSLTSKHYAHITPMRGHFLWREGWGPNGQMEIWSSDMFGFHPEADMWWSEPNGPDPTTGMAGEGENTWALLKMKYWQLPPQSPLAEVPMLSAQYVTDEAHVAVHAPDHSAYVGEAGHRRLHLAGSGSVRPVVPASVQWPALLEPEVLSCGPKGHVVALSGNGMAAVVPPEGTGSVTKLALEGLMELGVARGLTWGREAILVAMSSGAIAACQLSAGTSVPCNAMEVPRLPFPAGSAAPAVALFDVEKDMPLRAVMTVSGGRIALMELTVGDSLASSSWNTISQVLVPTVEYGELEIVALSTTDNHVIATASDGSALRWKVQGSILRHDVLSRDVPASGSGKTWRSSCAMPDGKVVRLASSWRKAGGSLVYKPELFV